MTDDQKAAYIFAQAALLNCEVAGMQAENAMRDRRGEAPAYTGDSFQVLYSRYAGILDDNNCIHFFHS